MFKSLNSLEKCMRKILISINNDDFSPDLEDNRDLAYAIYCCCEEGYILNLFYDQNANRDYIFQRSANMRVSKKGLEFIKQTSPIGLLKHNIFELLKGVAGYLLGIISALIVALITWHFGWI